MNGDAESERERRGGWLEISVEDQDDFLLGPPSLSPQDIIRALHFISLLKKENKERTRTERMKEWINGWVKIEKKTEENLPNILTLAITHKRRYQFRSKYFFLTFIFVK